MRGVKAVSLLMIACVFASSTFAQAPIKKPEKNKQNTTTITTQQKPKTNTNINKSSQPKTGTNTPTNNSSASTSTNTQGRSNSTTTTTTTPVPKPTTGSINGHEWVDLGLSVKWATCNVSASSPSDYGNYYAWGETSTKSSYTGRNSKTYGKNLGSIAGNPTYDAARANWGGSWRLPTADEIDELMNKCTRTWTSQGGHNGYKVTGPNGNSIFLPAAGRRNETLLDDVGKIGYYWCASPGELHTNYACSLYFFSDGFFRGWGSHNDGYLVRPVSE